MFTCLIFHRMLNTITAMLSGILPAGLASSKGNNLKQKKKRSEKQSTATICFNSFVLQQATLKRVSLYPSHICRRKCQLHIQW